MTLCVSDFQEALVPFNAQKVKNPQLIWMSNDLGMGPLQKVAVLEKFSYAISETPCLGTIEFDPMDLTPMQAERYGGAGSRGNGGGARCGNIGKYQLKGVGANMLVGEDVPHWYSHGSFNIVDAVCEILYSHALNRAYPGSAVPCFALVMIDSEAGFYSDVPDQSTICRCPSVILVREAVLRPAHFFRARAFKENDNLGVCLSSDVHRTRVVNKELLYKLGSGANFVTYLSEFIRRSANHFSFFRIAGVCHGAVSESNLSSDGRWLDLTVTSFLDPEENYHVSDGKLALFKEYEVVKDIIFEWVSTFSKFNYLNLNAGPLLVYYEEAMEYYLHKHCSYLLGLSEGMWPDKGENRNADIISVYIQGIISKKIPVTNCYFGKFENYSLSSFISELYLHFSRGEFGEQPNMTIALGEKFYGILEYVYNNYGTDFSEFKHFVVWAGVNSFKRIYLTKYFDRSRIRPYLKKLSENRTVGSVRKCIEQSTSFSDWVFESKVKEKLTLYKSLKYEVYYLFNKEVYEIQIVSCGETKQYTSIRSLIEDIKNTDHSALYIEGFSCERYMSDLIDFLSVYDDP